jgi:hypothetical protein
MIDMSEPWFRQWFGLGFTPIRWQGWAMTGALFAIELPLFSISPRLAANVIPWWLVVLLHVAIFMTFNAIAGWKSTRSRRR